MGRGPYDVGQDALGIMPGEHEAMGDAGVPGYPQTQAGGGTGESDAIDQMILGRRVVDPLTALYGLRAARRANTGATAQGVKFINLHRPSVYDQLSELALVIGALRARSQARKRQAAQTKATNKTSNASGA